MKRLILMRHAKAAPPRGGDGDFQRVLAERGRYASPRVGAFLRAESLVPEVVLVSAAARTRETYQLVAQAAGLPSAVFDRELYLASPEAILGFIRRVSPRTRSLMVIGHNPGLEDLTQILADDGESDLKALARAAEKFPTAALAIFDVLTPWGEIREGDCALKRFVTPADLGGVDED